METEFQKSKIERTKRVLYDRDESQLPTQKPAELSHEEVDVANDWIEAPPAYTHTERTPIGVTLLKIMVAIAAVAAIGALAFLAYTLWKPGIQPSDKNIDLMVNIPVSVPSGAKTIVALEVRNRNSVALEYATLVVTYPEGTKQYVDGKLASIHEEKKMLGTITAGNKSNYNKEVVFFGQESVDQQVSFRIEYRFAGTNAIFSKEASRPIRLSSSPIDLTVETLKEINAGQTLDLAITARANTLVGIDDIVLTIEYPQGFDFVDATPKPTYGNNTWKIGSLKSGDKFTLRLRGVVTGEEASTKVFRTTIGVASERQEREVATVYQEKQNEVSIKQPFIGISLFFDGKPVGESVANFGQQITGRVDYNNNLQAKILNVQIEVKLSGTAFDRTTVSAGGGGYYRSIDRTIFWDERGKPDLTLLETGSNGSVDFSFLPYPSVSGGVILRNPVVTAEITVRGKRVSETGVPEEIKTVVVKNVRLTSEAQFTTRAVYSTGPFVNRGPIPPIVEQETTYTVIWSIINTSNDLRDATVRATLPVYARWNSSVSPMSENVSYNSTTHEVVWTPGDIPAGTGIGASSAKQVAFQVVFLPSITQYGATPALLTEHVFTAQDAYTLHELRQTKDAVTISLSTDPKYTDDDGVVGR